MFRGGQGGRGRSFFGQDAPATFDDSTLQDQDQDEDRDQDHDEDQTAETEEKGVVARDEGVATAVSILYVTASPTFTGAIVGYSTDFGGSTDQTPAAIAAAAATPSADQQQDAQPSQPSSEQATTSRQRQQPSPSLSAASITSSSDGQTQGPRTSSQNRSLQTSLAASSTRQATESSSTGSTTDEQSQQSASQSPTVSQRKSGMSAGATAGVVIGLLIALALVAGVILFFWRRRKSKGDKFDDEKSFISPGPRGSGPAPRLSLGPGLIPGFGGNAAPRQAMTQHPTDSEARLTIFPSSAVANASKTNPFGRQGEIAAGSTNMPVAAAAAVGAGASGQAAAASMQSNPFSDSNASSAPNMQARSPPGSSGNAMAAVAGARSGSPASPSPSNVHRVQLNFQPTMDDELELQSGQVVRLMHEYDDGWALCMRMDRSKQGVCPRTCLSKLPIKARHQASPSPPNRNYDQQGDNQQYPAPGRDPMMPKPLSPSSSSTKGNGSPRGHGRSASAGRQADIPGSLAPGSTYQQTHRRSSSVGAWGKQNHESISPDDSASLRAVKQPFSPGAAR